MIGRSGIARLVCCALCAVVLSAVLPVPAPAAPASSAATKRRLLAKVAALETALDKTRPALMKALEQADIIDEKLQAARDDVANSEANITQLDVQIMEAEAALNDRAVSMYKSGSFDLVEAFLSVRTFEDLLTRMDMLSYIQQSDDELLKGLAVTRSQVDYLRQQQSQRQDELIVLNQEADARKAAVEAIVSQQEALLADYGRRVTDLAKQEAAADAGSAANGDYPGTDTPATAFNANTLISNANYGDATAMSVEQIQSFLQSQPGRLKSLTARDHNGVSRGAAQMISDAAVAWNVNPKVVLVTLQKEQSLISNAHPTQRALDWAMGCGKMDGSTLSQYKGFGNQIWGGTRALARNRSYWRDGISLRIDGKAVYPSNSATHSLYRYTPHLHGNVLFWRLYWRYFGNPVG